MDIQVNGVQRDVQAHSLAALLDELGYGDRRVATALNGRFVPGRQRADKSLSAGDAVEIVAPMQGG
jgi:sulfur carrier protein